MTVWQLSDIIFKPIDFKVKGHRAPYAEIW